LILQIHSRFVVPVFTTASGGEKLFDIPPHEDENEKKKKERRGRMRKKTS
jgi:hypothetical protein